MANMSYCMFENTSMDLRDCVTTMEEACNMRELDLSKSERSAFEHMRDLCERFLEAAAHLEAADDAADGQPDEAQEWADFDPDC